MRTGTVVISILIHAGVAFLLMSRAETKARHRAISVAVAGENKKPDRPKPLPPKPIVHHAMTKTVPAKVEAPEPAAAPKAVAVSHPVQTAVALSNADLAPGGIAVAGTPKLEHAAAVKVASAVAFPPRHRIGGSEPGGVPEENCDEEPTKPIPVYKTEIEYTAAARAEGVEGRLVLKLTIAADGSVSDVEVVSSVNEALDASAIASVKQWRFKPALKCGRPVAGGVFKFGQRFELTD